MCFDVGCMAWSVWLTDASAMHDLKHHTWWPWVLRIELKARCLIIYSAKLEKESKMWEISWEGLRLNCDCVILLKIFLLQMQKEKHLTDL